MTFPASPVPPPAIVRQFAAGRAVRAVWVNEIGGVTFRIGTDDAEAEFVKVADARAADFAGEAARLRWAGKYVTVPPVLGVGVDGRSAWLRTRGLAGVSAVHPRLRATPELAVRAIGVGLRTLHDRLPVSSCPFEWSVATRLATLPPAAASGLGGQPPIDRLVVCHGDACAPNILIDERGRYCGYVDLGDLGVADRWADLAVATLSLGWNFPGRAWDTEFFAAYGVEPDPERIDFYRRLWQAGDATSR
ncbi:phosphotransferase [Mycobacterium sp. E3247]|uniref:phosphotransferase n=1 Tax=Mycobacterium sp. E3247 TaxID=1856864 RepID=UPI0007FFA1AD|nr:phosphotransferase [Mycobacterium sp. E3247]OBH11180.1 aminoglycoside phosphotransferase APH(3') [Mycobacterium sp. E3247]